MKIVDLSKVQRSSKRRKAVKAKLAKLKTRGENIDMTLDEIRAAILELMEK
jgi:hypothetical protein